MRRAAAVIALALAAFAGAAAAQSWPQKPIRWIVPFPPGGSTDIAVRPVAEAIGKALGQPVVVENKPGAAGNIGADLVAKSAPDGYTVLASVDSIAMAPHIDAKLPFDPLKDFAPVTQLSRQPVMLAVHPSLGVATVADLVKVAKEKPGLAYATSGAGTQQHLVGEWFAKLAGIKLTHVPYRGGGQAIAELVGGQVTIGSLGSSPLIPHWKAGKLKLLAQSTAKRSPGLEEIPTYAESGYPDIVVDQWLGVMVPAKTPPEIVARLNAEIVKALADPGMRERYAKAALEPVGGTAAEFAEVVKRYHAVYGRLVKELALKVD